MIRATVGILASQGGVKLLLDTYTGAAAAYSLRLLRTAYTGDAIEVRRASDNSTQDIGFVNNELDVTSLESFCSSTNGFVTTWYDQSGNGNDATQSTDANQPQIVSSGSVILENGKPALQFDGSNDALSGNPSTSGAYTAYAILKSNTQTNYRGIYTTSQMMMLGNTSVNKWGTFEPGGALEQAANTDIRGTHSLLGMISSAGTSGTFYRNGSADGTYAGSATQYGAGGYIGGVSDQYISANIQEIIFWEIDQSSNRSGIETNINDFYSIY